VIVRLSRHGRHVVVQRPDTVHRVRRRDRDPTVDGDHDSAGGAFHAVGVVDLPVVLQQHLKVGRVLDLVAVALDAAGADNEYGDRRVRIEKTMYSNLMVNVTFTSNEPGWYEAYFVWDKTPSRHCYAVIGASPAAGHKLRMIGGSYAGPRFGRGMDDKSLWFESYVLQPVDDPAHNAVARFAKTPL
jgi:hypothetical protein